MKQHNHDAIRAALDETYDEKGAHMWWMTYRRAEDDHRRSMLLSLSIVTEDRYDINQGDVSL